GPRALREALALRAGRVHRPWDISCRSGVPSAKNGVLQAAIMDSRRAPCKQQFATVAPGVGRSEAPAQNDVKAEAPPCGTGVPKAGLARLVSCAIFPAN